MDDLLKVFLAETTECLGEVDADAAALRSSPDDAARLDKVVRLLRSVRETSGFLGLPTLHVLARDVVAQLERAAAEGNAEIGALIADGAAKLRATVGTLQQPTQPASSKPASAASPKAADGTVLATKRPRRKKAAGSSAPAPQPAETAAPPAAESPAPVGIGEGSHPPVLLVDPNAPITAPATSAPVASAPTATAEASAAALAAPELAPDGSIRVNAGTVEQLLSTVARLMAAQTEMMQILRAGGQAPGGLHAEAPALPVPATPAKPEAIDAHPQPETAEAPAAESKRAPVTAADPYEDADKGKVVALAARRAPAAAEAASVSPVPAHNPAPATAQPAAKGSASIRLLLFRAASGTLKAVPLDQVARLEEVDLRTVNGSGGLWVMRSGAELLPLVPFDAGRRLPERGVAPVIIVSVESQWFGLLVDAVLEVVDATLAIVAAEDQPGHLGTALFGGRVVDVVDPAYHLPAPLRTASPPPRTARRKRAPASSQPQPEREIKPEVLEDKLFARKPAREVGS